MLSSRLKYAVLVACAGLCASALPAWAQVPLAPHKTVAFLQRLQAPDGGFSSVLRNGPGASGATPAPATLPATAAALRGFRYFGGEPRDVEACRHFVNACFDERTGGFGARPGEVAEVISTAMGAMALVELKMMTGEYRDRTVNFLGEHARSVEEIRMAVAALEALNQLPPQADTWRQQISQRANRDGTFGEGPGKARDTASAVMTLLRLGGDIQHREQVIAALKDGQRPDGGFGKAGAAGSDLETTYRVLRAFHMLHEKPKRVEQCLALVQHCHNADGGYGLTPGARSEAAPTYFAGAIRHWLGVK